MIPGQNLLNMALTVIAKQTVTYYAALDRQLGPTGLYITEYAPGAQVVGSFQPVPQKLYEQYGLDLQKEYFNFYASKNIIDVGRDVSGDQIAFQGLRYQCESNTEWFGEDGWNGILCIEIGPDVAVPQNIFGFGSTLNTYVNFENGNFAEEVA